jgi:hypothetical protein
VDKALMQLTHKMSCMRARVGESHQWAATSTVYSLQSSSSVNDEEKWQSTSTVPLQCEQNKCRTRSSWFPLALEAFSAVTTVFVVKR